MTAPDMFDDMPTASNYIGEEETLDDMGQRYAIAGEVDPAPEHRDPIMQMSEEQMNALTQWVDQWVYDLLIMHEPKQQEWQALEIAYRAPQDDPKSGPIVNACRDVIPVIAMAVEPVHARLETGIFKQDPVFRVKTSRKSLQKFMKPLERLLNGYMTQVIDFRKIATPRMLESAKLGTMVFKTRYAYEKCKYKAYGKDGKVETREEVRFQGPKPEGVELSNVMFPSLYQDIQDAPIVAERIRTVASALRVLEKQGKIKNVDKVAPFTTSERTEVERSREAVSNHTGEGIRTDDLVVWECEFEYDYDNDGWLESFIAWFHHPTRTFLRLQLNPNFRQRKSYTVIPYTISNQSLYGVGIGEMSIQFQNAVTRYHQMAMDNAYIANCRMFIAKRNAPGIEDVPLVYAGRTFFVDDPKNDFIPFQAGDIYPSTQNERMNLMGLVEKRTGVSDYMTGRESPMLGSRATATSTLALIQEGTRRVEQVMENIRVGFGDIAEQMCLMWAQYGLGDISDYNFLDDNDAELLDQFFKSINNMASLDGLISIDIGVTDATTNRQVQQQMQMSLIQSVTAYLQQLVEVGQLAVQAAGSAPQLVELISKVVSSADKMYTDLLGKYDIPGAEEYIPDVQSFFKSLQQLPVPGASGGTSGGPPGIGGPPDISAILGALPGTASNGPAGVGAVQQLPGQN